MAKIGSLEGVFALAPSQDNFHIHIGLLQERGKFFFLVIIHGAAIVETFDAA